jgi:hypothetical protein
MSFLSRTRLSRTRLPRPVAAIAALALALSGAVGLASGYRFNAAQRVVFPGNFPDQFFYARGRRLWRAAGRH